LRAWTLQGLPGGRLACVHLRNALRKGVAPGRIGGCLSQQGVVLGECGIALALLLLGERQEEACLDVAGFDRKALLASLPRRLDAAPVIGRNAGLGKAAQAPKGLSLEPRGPRKGIGCLRETAKPQIDGRDDVPALPVLGLFAQPRLYLGDEFADWGPVGGE